MSHQPVLLDEILSLAGGAGKPRWVFDATFGRGGHLKALKENFPSACLAAFDQDPVAVEWGRKNFPDQKKDFIFHENFHNFSKKKDFIFKSFSIQEGFDLILLDLGPSSPQLDDPRRGMSFYHEGPLDMRMNTSMDTLRAEELLNQSPPEELYDLFYELGGIRNPRPVIRALIRRRRKSPLRSTVEFSQLIERSIGWRKKGRHPATLYFLALRIKVNNELEGLRQSLPSLISALSAGRGRLFVLSFHSLEDRIVKNIFKNSCLKNEGFLVNKKVIRPKRAEVLSNPRSRSAKLRVFQKS